MKGKSQGRMKVLVRTANGSTYTLNPYDMTWSRTNKVGHLPEYESGSGLMVAFPEIVIGEPMHLPVVDERKDEGWNVIVTSNVRDFENVEV